MIMNDFNDSNKIQIIKKKINEKRFSEFGAGRYYQNLRAKIKKDVDDSADILMIQFIPQVPINDLAIIEALLILQREFTPILIAPKTSFIIDQNEIDELIKTYRAKTIMIGL